MVVDPYWGYGISGLYNKFGRLGFEIGWGRTERVSLGVPPRPVAEGGTRREDGGITERVHQVVPHATKDRDPGHLYHFKQKDSERTEWRT